MKLNVDIKKMKIKNISIILTSYEIVCEIERYAPNILYFLFDLHPLPIRKYTLRLMILNI